jgi:hypothetical protein
MWISRDAKYVMVDLDQVSGAPPEPLGKVLRVRRTKNRLGRELRQKPSRE